MSVNLGPWNDIRQSNFYASSGSIIFNSDTPHAPEPPARPLTPPLALSIRPGVVLRDQSIQAFSPTPASWTHDGRGVITACIETSTFLQWDLSSGTIVEGPISFTNQPNARYSVTISRDGRRFLAGGTNPNNPSLLYDIETGTSTAFNVGYNFGTILSHDGKSLLAFSMPIAVWDTATGNVTKAGQPGLCGEAAIADISADGKKAVSVSSDGKVTIWDMDSVDIIGGPYRDHEGAVKSIAFSPDATHLAIGLSTGSIVLMECDSGDLKPTPGGFKGHKDWVNSVAFSPNGKWLCSGSEDGTIRVWDAKTGHTLARPARHQGKVWNVTFSSDGRKILSNGSDRTVRTWIIEDIKVSGGE